MKDQQNEHEEGDAMGICAQEFRQYVVRPTLEHLGVSSAAAENLLLGTAAQESGLGFHLQQRNGQAIGIYQITPSQHRQLWDDYLAYQPDLASRVRGLASQREFLEHPNAELATNLSYATAVAWCVYMRCDQPLPDANDIDGIATYWARHFHQRPNGIREEFVQQYQQLLTHTGNLAA